MKKLEKTREPSAFNMCIGGYYDFNARKQGFRVNAKLRQQLRKCNRKLRNRIDVSKGIFQSPMIRPVNTKFELAEWQRGAWCSSLER